MNNPVIVLDADGVLLDLNEAWRRQAEIILKKRISLQSNLFEMTSRYGITFEEETIVWENIVWSDFPAIPGAISAVNKLISNGFSIHVITAISPLNQKKRIENLLELGIGIEHIHCVGFNESKTSTILSISPLALVDDRPKYLNDASKANVPNVYYYNHNYIDIPTLKGDYCSVSSWHELLPKLLALKSEYNDSLDR